jgi:heptaprenyl diphosphate synthase
MLSRCCVRSDLALPGAFGEMMGESFRFFSGMAGEKVFFTRRNWLQRLDGLLISYRESDANTEAKKEPEPKRSRLTFNVTKNVSRIILVIVTMLAWLPLLVKALPRL